LEFNQPILKQPVHFYRSPDEAPKVLLNLNQQV